MSGTLTIKTESLEPLFSAWEEPLKHRVRADSGEGATARNGRRPTGITLAQIIADFGGAQAETAALGITDEEDAWNRDAFKMATGSGKTKVMSLCIVWSYFHAIRESDSNMSRISW